MPSPSFRLPCTLLITPPRPLRPKAAPSCAGHAVGRCLEGVEGSEEGKSFSPSASPSAEPASESLAEEKGSRVLLDAAAAAMSSASRAPEPSRSSLCMYACMHPCMRVRTCAWMDGWMDGCICVHACLEPSRSILAKSPSMRWMSSGSTFMYAYACMYADACIRMHVHGVCMMRWMSSGSTLPILTSMYEMYACA